MAIGRAQFRSCFALLGTMVFLWTACPSPGSAQQDAAPPSPAETGKIAPGFVVVRAQYDAEGKVADCHVIRSNAPYELEVAAIDYISQHWRSKLFAGDTATFPIYFQSPPTMSPAESTRYWNQEMGAPPNLLSIGDPPRNLKLRLSFGSDGWVKEAKVVEPSGLEALDRQTAVWVRVHWHHDAYANQVWDTPFQFLAPVPPPPPLPIVPAVHLHPTPAEPVAIPAVRVE